MTIASRNRLYMPEISGWPSGSDVDHRPHGGAARNALERWPAATLPISARSTAIERAGCGHIVRNQRGEQAVN